MQEGGNAKRRSRLKLGYIVVGLVVVGLSVTAGLLWHKYSHLKKNPAVAAQETTKRLTESISKLYELPKDEQPTIAKVEDKEKLKDQAFFNNAENGDYILIYTNAKLALIYREYTNKLVNVGPITINDQQAVAGQQSKPVVKILNGSDNTRLSTTQNRLKEMADKIMLDNTPSDAKNKNTTKTTVVDLSGANSALANELALKIGGTIGSMPSGETAPTGVAIVVVVGRE